jgi:dTDP-4-amino-4,6-dideoxygalactose transaminase
VSQLSELAINGGAKAVTADPGDMFVHPVIDERDEKALLDMLHSGQMSSTDPGHELEVAYAEWHGMKYGLAHNTGTAALHGAFFGCGVGWGDEVICPSATYWASCTPVLSMGATVVFADIEPNTLCIDPEDIARKITPRTRCIVAVHCYGHPADMDPIMEIANAHGITVIEDVSHAHGGLYKGRMVGSIGHISAASIMTGKALPAGEGGLMLTNDQEVYERATVFGHYGRISKYCEMEEYKSLAGLPLGGHKYRLNGFCAALGKVQLEKFPGILAGKVNAAKIWWDALEDVPGIIPHRPKWEDSTLGGWYAAHGIYDVDAAPGNLPLKAFARAVQAEGTTCSPGGYGGLHMHPAYQDYEIYHEGVPTSIAHADRDTRCKPGDLPHTEASPGRTYSIPRFGVPDEEYILQCAAAYRKVLDHADEVPVEEGDRTDAGLAQSRQFRG